MHKVRRCAKSCLVVTWEYIVPESRNYRYHTSSTAARMKDQHPALAASYKSRLLIFAIRAASNLLHVAVVASTGIVLS